MSRANAHVAVVGAGIVGVCIAYQLRKRGVDVLLIDRDEPGRGCSYGNSGAISSASVVPLATPGIIRSVPGMLGKPDSPLFLPWRYLPQALPWLLQFVQASRKDRVLASAKHLAELHHEAVARHIALASEVGRPDLIIQRGHLHLYPDKAALQRDAFGWQLRRDHGVQYQILDRDGILQLEPNVSPRYQTGVFMADQATVANPFQYVQAIARKYQDNGGRLRSGVVQAITPAEGGQWHLDVGGDVVSVSQVVVAAGVWSRKLLEPLGVKLALESQRGYHVQFQGGPAPVSRTVVLTDQRVFLTPMTDGLRVGGTVEIAGVNATPDPRRAEALARIALESFSELADQPYTTWSGHRPCMPDSVPVIGPADNHRGLFIATGHGHLGLTDSIGTAQRIVGMIQSTLF